MASQKDALEGLLEEERALKTTALIAGLVLVGALALIAYAVPCINSYGLPPYAQEGAKAYYRVEAAGINETYTRVVEVVQANATHITLHDRLLHPNGTVVGEEVNTIRLTPRTFLPGLPLTEDLYPLGLKVVDTPMGPIMAQQYVDLALGVYYAIDPESMVAIVITQAGPLGVINQTLTQLELPQECRLG